MGFFRASEHQEEKKGVGWSSALFSLGHEMCGLALRFAAFSTAAAAAAAAGFEAAGMDRRIFGKKININLSLSYMYLLIVAKARVDMFL